MKWQMSMKEEEKIGDRIEGHVKLRAETESRHLHTEECQGLLTVTRR